MRSSYAMFFETIRQDIVYALRAMRRNPAFTATALAALAIGIGANSAIFSVIDAVLLKPLVYPDPDHIAYFFVTTPAGPSYGASATKFNELRKQTSIFQDVSAYEFNGAQLNVTGGALPEQIHGIRVSEAYFRLFGAPVIQGRTFTGDEDRPNGDRVVVISYGLWQRRFGGDPGQIGQTISLGGAAWTVIGVLGPKFDTGLDTPPDVWLPFQIDPASNDNAQYFNIAARLKPNVTFAQATARLQRASLEFRERFPNIMGPRDSFAVQPLYEGIVSDVRPSLLVLAGAVSFVLLIACANVANLLLVRASGRKREMAIRAAVGASRGRIMRQLLIESVVLSIAGGGLGLTAGLLGVRTLLAINPGDIPRISAAGATVHVDWRLLAFTAALSLFTGILFGLVPALEGSRSDITTTLKESGGRSGYSRRQSRTRAVLVVGEVALAIVLVLSAALLIRSFFALRAVNPGFDPHNVITMRMSLAGSRFQKTPELALLIRSAVHRMEAIPGVSRAAVSYSLPLEGIYGVPFNILGRTPASGQYDGRGWMGVSPGYFDVFRIPILRGRGFNERDDAAEAPVAIINQAMSRKFWTHGDPLADRVLLGRGYGPEFAEPPRQIIGIAADVHDTGLNRDPVPAVYVPLAQITDGITALASRAGSLAWVARTKVEPHSLRSPIEAELQKATGGLPVAHVRSMDEVLVQSTARADFNMSLLATFGCSALLLAAIGIYGLMAYSVRQRTQELGIRMALGASARHVRNMIVLQGMRLTACGIALGMISSLGLTRLIAGFLFGVRTSDPVAFALVPVLLGSVALFAVWLPAQRATRVDPVDALRSE